MCSKCRSQYGKGGWDKDKEGNDEFCRYLHLYTEIYLYPKLQCVIELFSGGVLKEDKFICVTSVLMPFVTSASDGILGESISKR